MNDPKLIRGWCMYDWANSVYSLVITSAIFPVYYQAVTRGPDGGDVVRFFGFPIVNSVLYAYALSVSFLVVAALLPMLSGVADYAGRKKRYMKFFAFTGAVSCMGLFFFDGHNIEWGILCCVMASIGFSGSLVFYDAYLPEIVTEDRYDQVSARGYAMGYYGSVLLMVLCLVLIQFHGYVGIPSEGAATRLSFVMVGLWWMLFAIYSFSVLPANPYQRKPTGRIYHEGYLELVRVFKSLSIYRGLRTFLLAYFFYNMGVQTVMYLAATYGSKELQLPDTKLIVTVLLIQLVAAFGAFTFARFSRSQGNKKALVTMIIVWIGICIYAYFLKTEYQFYGIAIAVGLVMGGIQSLSRATYSKLLPRDTISHASYFSFYDVTYNLSIVFGTASYGFIEQVTGSMRNSTLALMTYFIIGLLLLITIKMDFRKPAVSIAGA